MNEDEEDETALDDRSYLIRAGKKGDPSSNPRDTDTPCVELVINNNKQQL